MVTANGASRRPEVVFKKCQLARIKARVGSAARNWCNGYMRSDALHPDIEATMAILDRIVEAARVRAASREVPTSTDAVLRTDLEQEAA